ncbi:VanZ family protein [Tepidiforma sp.]|uniref:VanZ family protein n=1 Tax=Tepidiforma sp. TaxID=2682230 RepID=UPI002ADE4A4F|nr:VanZ family protein [Tepidiforma sp.]
MSARTATIALIAWAALIFILSSFPNPPGPRVTEPRAILAHVVMYAVLGYLAAHALAARRGRFDRWHALAAWLFAVAYGISDEFHQSFVPNRHATALDVLADAVGAAIGVLAARIALRRTARGFAVRTAARPGRESPRSAK